MIESPQVKPEPLFCFCLETLEFFNSVRFSSPSLKEVLEENLRPNATEKDPNFRFRKRGSSFAFYLACLWWIVSLEIQAVVGFSKRGGGGGGCNEKLSETNLFRIERDKCAKLVR